MNLIKKNKHGIITILVIALIASAVAFFFQKQSEYTEIRYDLEEIESGIYARYYKTHSSIPAENYEVVEICINGNLYTYDGDIFISYTSENPYVVVMQNNLVHGNKVYLHAPKGTVEYLENVGIR